MEDKKDKKYKLFEKTTGTTVNNTRTVKQIYGFPPQAGEKKRSSMAKLEQGILGPFRGKVGTVVGYLWRGRQVVRAYRREINYPNTEMQQAEREWFVGMVRFAATARQALLLGLREKAERDVMTEGNVFVRMNKGCFGRDAARRVRSETPLRPAATSPCEGEEREDTVSNQRYTTDNHVHTPSGCSPLHGAAADAARRVRTGMAPLRPAATSPCEGEERENAINNQEYINRNQIPSPSGCSPLQGEEREDTVSSQRYTTGNQAHAPSGCSPLQGELPEGVRGGIDYERIRIAEGSAAPVRFSTASVDEDNVLRVDYEKNSGMTRAKGSDRVYIYVYNIYTREGILSHPAERRRGHLEMQLPEGWNERNVKMWGFVVDSEGRASGSAYIALGEASAKSEENAETELLAHDAGRCTDDEPLGLHLGQDAAERGSRHTEHLGSGGDAGD